MRLMIEYLDGEYKGERLDISKNLYWFEENGVREMNDRGECEDFRGHKYKIVVPDEADGL